MSAPPPSRARAWMSPPHRRMVVRQISGAAEGYFRNDTDKLAGRFLAELQFSTIDEIFDYGLHQYLDDAQLKLNNIGVALFNAYIFQPFQSPEGEHMVQQEEQQQQFQSAIVNRKS